MKTAITLLLLATPALAQEAPWKEAEKRDKLVIYTREKAGSDIREVKAIGEMDAPSAQVWKAVGDYDRYATYLPFVEQCRILSKESERVFFVYQLITTPIVAKRDFTIKITWDPEDGSGRYRSSWIIANDRGPAENSDFVRVKINDGSWTIEPLDGGKRARATYYLYLDVGGSIPRWIANMANTSAIPDLFKAVNERARKLLSGEVK
jgi:hypothetical protein